MCILSKAAAKQAEHTHVPLPHHCRGPEGVLREPNNLFGNEGCAAANASQTYDMAWGWADANCNMPMTFMCRLNSEWLAGWQKVALRGSVSADCSAQ